MTMTPCPNCRHINDGIAFKCAKCERPLFTEDRVTTPTVSAPKPPSASSWLPPAAPAAALTRVSVVDFNMPFASMVGLMIKWTLATIPALFILAAAGFVGFTALTLLTASLIGLAK